MPNNTTNFVTIGTNTNVDEEILALQELKTDLNIKEGEFDFEGIIPMPEEIKKGATLGFDIGTGEKIEHEDYENIRGVYKPKNPTTREYLMMEYGADNWYDFACLHWGTKWNSYDVEVLQDDESILYVAFLSAWDAPRGIAERIKEYCDEYNLYLDWDAEHEFEDGIDKIA